MKNWKMCLKLIFLMMFSGNVFAEKLDVIFKEVSIKTEVRERLLRSICWVESKHEPYAYRHGDAGKQNHAFGMCQVLYTTAVSLGLHDSNCKKDFRDVSYADRIYKNCKLFGPKTNITFAAKFLKQLLKKYKGNEFKSISAYNLGRYKECRDGFLYYQGQRFKPCVIGGPANLYYINAVQKALIEGR